MDVQLVSFSNPVFASYALCSAILVFKMFLMAALTAVQRFRKMVFANPEDTRTYSGGILKYDDPDVERVRRAHRNDLESLVPFFVVGFLYVLTNPGEFLALNIFWMVTISRITHTLVYAVVPLPQPCRALAFFGSLLPTSFMAVQVARAFY